MLPSYLATISVQNVHYLGGGLDVDVYFDPEPVALHFPPEVVGFIFDFLHDHNNADLFNSVDEA